MTVQNAPLPEAPAERPEEYRAEVSFDELGLSPEVLRAISERGYTHPTPVQAKAFAPVVAGKDLIVRSKTGTGKTAAFGLPLLEKIAMGERKVKALILCPTRELAIQVAAELTALAKYKNLRVTAIYGGASMKTQEDALEDGSAIIVGTPGRVYDHIRRKNMKLEHCTHAVLDEADEMLNQGFYEEVTRILDCLPQGRQVLLFSATVPEDIQRLIAKYTTDAETLLLSGDVYTVDHITHVRYDVSEAYPKPRNLIYMLEMEEPSNAIIFCNTRDDTELVTAVLNRNGFDAELLNGDLPQKERERVMGRIKRGEVAFMVATDLAARGIDISDLGHVINYTLPEDPAVYLHRVGRTGRIGKTGVALNLVSGREMMSFAALEKKYGITFEKRTMPTPAEAVEMWTERHVAEIKEAASGAIYEGFLGLASEMKRRPDADELIAFMLRFFFAERRKQKMAETGMVERPPRVESKPPPRREEGGKRGGREERGPRRERSDRPPRDEAPRATPRDEVKTVRMEAMKLDETTAPVAAVAPAAPSNISEVSGVKHSAPPRENHRPASSGPAKKKLTDRELFDLMQAGKPIPPMDDPTADDSVAASSEEHPRRERSERAPRGESSRERRPRREKSELVPAEPGQARVWINLGTLDALDAGSLPRALEALGAPAGEVQRAEVLRSFSYLFVPEGSVPAFEALTGKAHGEKALKLEKARK